MNTTNSMMFSIDTMTACYLIQIAVQPPSPFNLGEEKPDSGKNILNSWCWFQLRIANTFHM